MTKGTLEDYINDNAEVTDYFCNDRCSECGNCCSRYLALSNKEINTIKAYIKRNNIKRQYHSSNVLANKVFDMTCPFLDDDKQTHKCTIYPVRPMICKEFTCRAFVQGKRGSMALYKEPRTKVDMTEMFFGKGEKR